MKTEFNNDRIAKDLVGRTIKLDGGLGGSQDWKFSNEHPEKVKVNILSFSPDDKRLTVTVQVNAHLC